MSDNTTITEPSNNIDNVQLNVRVSKDHATYARVAAAKLGKPLSKVVQEALELHYNAYPDIR